MKREASTPEAYCRAVESPLQEVLLHLRSLIRAIAPHIEEQLRYNMLDYPGLANLGAQKHYVSLYVLPRILNEFKERHPELDCGKSCLRFRNLETVNDDLIRALLTQVLAARAGDEDSSSH